MLTPTETFLETQYDWTPADHVFNSPPRIMYMKEHFLVAALSNSESIFRKYFILEALSEIRLMQLVLEFEGTVDLLDNISNR